MQQPEPQSFDRVLSSMCTEPHPAAREAAERYLATNPGDPATYESIAALEARAVELLATVTDHPTPTDAAGYVTSGGTEANVQAVRSARHRHDATDVNVVVPESGHFSFHKAAEVLDVELRTVPVDDEFRTRTDAVDAAVDDATALVVGVAGSTEYGRVDPIPTLTRIAHDAGARMHVDAAWGGFVLPFTDAAWSFADAPIDTLTIDPHKFGQAPVPAGGLLARDAAALDALAVDRCVRHAVEIIALGVSDVGVDGRGGVHVVECERAVEFSHVEGAGRCPAAGRNEEGRVRLFDALAALVALDVDDPFVGVDGGHLVAAPEVDPALVGLGW